MVGLANWPGKKVADLAKRFVERTKEPWFGHDSIFAYVHVMILKEALERAGAADRKKVNAAIRKLDMTDGPALFFPDGRLKYDAQRPPRRRQAVHRAVAEGPAGGGPSAGDRLRRGDLAEDVLTDRPRGGRLRDGAARPPVPGIAGAPCRAGRWDGAHDFAVRNTGSRGWPGCAEHDEEWWSARHFRHPVMSDAGRGCPLATQRIG